MQCRDIRRWMEEFATEGLDPARSAEFHAHLDDCTTCRAEWQAVTEIDDLLARMVPVEAPAAALDAIRRGVQDRLDLEPAPRRAWWPRLAAVGALASFLLMVLLVRHGQPVPARPSADPEPERVAAAPRVPPADQPAPTPPRVEAARPAAKVKAAPVAPPAARPAAAPVRVLPVASRHRTPARPSVRLAAAPAEVVAEAAAAETHALPDRAAGGARLPVAAPLRVAALAAPVVRARSTGSFSLAADEDPAPPAKAATPVAATRAAPAATADKSVRPEEPAEPEGPASPSERVATDALRVEPAVVSARVVPLATAAAGE